MRARCCHRFNFSVATCVSLRSSSPASSPSSIPPHPRARPAGRRGGPERLRQVQRDRRRALGAGRDLGPAAARRHMQDVIFNGSGNRKPVARASVELVFDNSLGRAAGQWSQYAEIAVQARAAARRRVELLHQQPARAPARHHGHLPRHGPRAARLRDHRAGHDLARHRGEARGAARVPRGGGRHLEVPGAPPRDRDAPGGHAREPLARRATSAPSSARRSRSSRRRPRSPRATRSCRRELQLKQQLLWYLRRRDAGAERERARRGDRRLGNELEAENAELRALETRLESARAAHYQAGDAMNAAQGALYAANAEVARHESELRHVRGNAQRAGEAAHASGARSSRTWREQRSQLTQALHMWAARAGSAKERVADSAGSRRSRSGAPAAGRAGIPRRAGAPDRGAQRSSCRRRAGCSSSRRTARTWSAPPRRSGSARERLQAELQALTEPDAARAGRAAGARRARPRGAARARRRGSTALQDGLPALQERRAQRPRRSAPRSASMRRRGAARDAAPDPGRDREQRAAARVARAPGPRRLPRAVAEAAHRAGWETAVEAVLRERLHALRGGRRSPRAFGDRPPAQGEHLRTRRSAGATTQRRRRCRSRARCMSPTTAISGALADWLAGVYRAVDGMPRCRDAAAIARGRVLVNRAGPSVHAPHRRASTRRIPATRALLARQAEIEDARGALRRAWRDSAERRERALEQAEAELPRAQAALDERAPGRSRRQEQARHDARSRAEARRRPRSGTGSAAPRSAELEELDAEPSARARGARSLRGGCERIGGEIAAARERLEHAARAHIAAETALAEQRERGAAGRARGAGRAVRRARVRLEDRRDR